MLTSIGTNGADASTVAVQVDGKIIVGGTDSANFVLVRYLTNGLLDTSFGGGIVITPIGTSVLSTINAILIQPDGKIVAGGTDGSNFVLARYLTNGSLDTTFNSAGTQPGVIVTTIDGSIFSFATSVALQTDGNIVAGGTDGSNFVVARYLTDGTLDTTFNSSGLQPGIAVTSIGVSGGGVVNAVAIQADGNIVAIGEDSSNFVVARYLTDGTLDPAFNSAGAQPGVVVTPIANSAMAFAGGLQANGKIVAAGVAFVGSGNQNFALARYLNDGSLDTTFGIGGIVITTIPNDRFFSASAMTIQSDGKIIAAGLFTSTLGGEEFALARYLTNGTLDTSFNSTGTTPGIVTTAIETNAFISGLALQTDGKIIAAGGAGITGSPDSFAVARYISTPLLNPTTITPPILQPSQPITLNGTAQNESIITIIIDGVVTNFSTVTPLNISGNESDTTGTWSIGIGALTPGLHTIAASTSYKTGNVILSAPLAICVPLLSVSIMPLSQTICTGNAITLTAEVTGGTAANFIWTTPGRGTITTITNVLTLPNSTTSDSGNYTVVAVDINGCSSDASAPASVTVVSLLSASIIPLSQAICIGNTITLTAEVVGGSPVNFIWTTPGRGTITTTTNVLTLPNSTISDSGNYTVVAVDINGCSSDASAPASIVVVVGPTVTLVTNCDVVSPCSQVTFTAKPTGGTPPYELIWFDGVTETGVTGPVTRTITPTQAISVVVVDANGCRASANAHTSLSQAIFEKYCA